MSILTLSMEVSWSCAWLLTTWLLTSTKHGKAADIWSLQGRIIYHLKKCDIWSKYNIVFKQWDRKTLAQWYLTRNLFKDFSLFAKSHKIRDYKTRIIFLKQYVWLALDNNSRLDHGQINIDATSLFPCTFYWKKKKVMIELPHTWIRLVNMLEHWPTTNLRAIIGMSCPI